MQGAIYRLTQEGICLFKVGDKLTVGDEDPALETVVGSGYRLFDPGVKDGTDG